MNVKVGISYMGLNKARENADELTSWNVEDQQAKCVAAWNDILSQIDAEGGSEDVRKIFYTCI